MAHSATVGRLRKRNVCQAGASDPFIPIADRWSVGGFYWPAPDSDGEIRFCVEVTSDGVKFAPIEARGLWTLDRDELMEWLMPFDGIPGGIVAARLIWAVAGPNPVFKITALCRNCRPVARRSTPLALPKGSHGDLD